MTPIQIENKIKELEYWLEHNHSHPNRTIIEADLRKLREDLLKPEDDAPGGN